MDSPSSSSIVNFYYNEYFADGDGFTDEEIEQEAVTSACQLAVRYVKHCRRPQVLKMAEKTTRDSLEHFCRGIIDVYGARYLRTPTWDDLQKIYEVHNAEHGLPGMIGSIDCMHWRWDNCPTAWRGQHTRGDQKGPAIILQAVTSQDLWVWSAYFGVVGPCNDINVFEQSPLLEEWISGKAPKASFYANGNYYPHGYYLSDGIYPRYSIFAKTFSDPIDEKKSIL
ncbi:uncharacterized protein LOC118484779 [Helianthus annuus]|uniref:uncharacterized protein LOC118484779 n=1 Tax=Helianthus annuus TaxID=4232 RepID=UPI0016531218|nr:uncharacterized protein LOC118484779 [Helianthus annuus]